MNPGYPQSQYSPGVSHGQDASPISVHRGSIDHALSSSNSNSSLEESLMQVELMSRTVSDDGTLGSWQLVSPSPPAGSSPELARPTPSSRYGARQSFPEHAFSDEDYPMSSQVSYPSSQEPELRFPLMGEPAMDETSPFSYGYNINLPTSTSSASTLRGIAGNESPWSPMAPNYRIPSTIAHDILATSMPFVPASYTPSFNTQFPFSSQPQHVTFEQVQTLDNQNYLHDYNAQRHRSRSSSNSHVPMLTPPSMTMDLSFPNPQTAPQIPHLSIERPELSHSLVAHAGSEKDMASSPSSSSEYVMVEQPSSSKPTSQGRRKRVRVEAPFAPASRQNQGKFSTLTFSQNQRNAIQSQPGVSKSSSSKARGGRKKGSNLAPKTATGAREMREKVACWQCALQRDVCTTNETCDRCVKRHERGIIDSNHSIGCIREKLFDYMNLFIPHYMNTLYDEDEVRKFATAHIGTFINAPIRIELQPIYGLPHILCELYEFQPRDRTRLTQTQYWLNKDTDQYEKVECMSAPVSFKRIGTNADEQQAYDNYVAMLADNPNHMHYFARKIFFADEKDKFLSQLLTALVEYQPVENSKNNFIGSVNRLLIASFIFTRGCLIPAKERVKLERLRFYQENPGFSFRTLPRMAGRQFKHTFLRILTNALKTVLGRLDRIFRSSQGSKEWTMAFYGVLGLAMTFENMQVMVRAVLHSEVTQNATPYHQARSELSFIIGRIDEKFSFISKLFRLKYNRSFNPIVNLESRDRLDFPGSQLVSRITELLQDNWELATQRQRDQPSLESSDMYFGRLVSQFLCSVSSPP